MLVRPHSNDDGFMLFWDTSQQNLLTGAACTIKMKSSHPLNGLEINNPYPNGREQHAKTN